MGLEDEGLAELGDANVLVDEGGRIACKAGGVHHGSIPSPRTTT